MDDKTGSIQLYHQESDFPTGNVVNETFFLDIQNVSEVLL